MEINNSNIVDSGLLNNFTELFDLEDYKFDIMYDFFKDIFNGLENNEKIKNHLLEQLKTVPNIDLEAEKKAINAAQEEIKNQEVLSKNKKEMLNKLLKLAYTLLEDVVTNPRERIEVKIEKIKETAKIPEYAHQSDAGADVFCAEAITIEPQDTKVVSTGIKLAIPKGYEVQVRPRSGLSLKSPLRIANAPGTIDSEFRGEVGIIMTNISNSPYTINQGDKIAQLIISPVPMMNFIETKIDTNTDRGENGFGSSDG